MVISFVVTLFPVSGVVVDVDSDATGAGEATAGAAIAEAAIAGAGVVAAGAGSAAAGAGADTVVVTSDETLTTPVEISTECCSTSLCAFVSTVTPGSPSSPFSAANTLISPNAVAPPTARPAAMTLFASLDIFPVFSL